LEGILEAPRGPRDVNVDGHYVPAYKHGPSAAQFPCAGNNSGCGGSGCCTTGASAGTGLADTPAIGYPKLTSAGDTVPGGDKSRGAEESGAELLPPTDVPATGEGQSLR
jgi:hypothetical protein